MKPKSTGLLFEVELPIGHSEAWTSIYDQRDKADGACFTDVESFQSCDFYQPI